jgi:hypothetical protein
MVIDDKIIPSVARYRIKHKFFIAIKLAGSQGKSMKIVEYVSLNFTLGLK